MKDLRTLTVRQLIFSWLGGIALAMCIFAGASVLTRQVVRSVRPQLVRRQLLAGERARELDSAWAQYARAHPEDAAAQGAAQRRGVASAESLRRDSISRALVQSGTVDTSYNARDNSERAWVLRFTGYIAFATLFVTGLLIPVALVVLTAVWGAHRLRLLRARASA